MTGQEAYTNRSKLILGLSHKFPWPFRFVLTLCIKGYLPIRLYDHWLSQTIAKNVWSNTRVWISRRVRLPNGLQIEIDARDYIGRAILENGYYEPETVNFLGLYLKPGMTFLDIGANIGLHTLIGSSAVGSRGEVHAFEPDPFLCDVVKRNLSLNNRENTIINNVAVARQDGTKPLFLSSAESFGTTSFLPAENYSGLKLSVVTTSIDAYVRSRHLRQVDLIKLDIEGGELEALEGARGVLKDYPEAVLIVEFCETTARRFGHTTEHLRLLLKGLGFKLFRLGLAGIIPYTPSESDPAYFNVIASRRELSFTENARPS